MEISIEYLDRKFKEEREYFNEKSDVRFQQYTDIIGVNFELFGKNIGQKIDKQTKELKCYVYDSFEMQQLYMMIVFPNSLV